MIVIRYSGIITADVKKLAESTRRALFPYEVPVAWGLRLIRGSGDLPKICLTRPELFWLVESACFTFPKLIQNLVLDVMFTLMLACVELFLLMY